MFYDAYYYYEPDENQKDTDQKDEDDKIMSEDDNKMDFDE